MTAEHAEGYNVADLTIANEKPAERRRAIVASAIGNFLELFDFAIYGFLAIPLGAHFFPSTDPLISLLSSFATFGVGFIMRPVGAVVIGIYGDRKGRKAALSLTIVMMASATGVVGFLPSYASIGIAAPILLVLCRMVQGFATGGEWGGAAAFLVEHSPDKQRGLVSSLQQIGNHLGGVVGSGLVAALTFSFTHSDYMSWGWRIPFLIGFLVGPLGYYLRTRVADTPTFRQAVVERRVERTPLRTVFSLFGPRMLAATLISIIGTTTNFTFTIYLMNFAIQQQHLPADLALLSLTLSHTLLIFGLPVVGWLSDKVGRKPLMLIMSFGFVVASYPMFRAITDAPSILTLFIVQFSYSLLQVFYTGTIAPVLAELFPTRVRFTGLSVSYGLAVTLFGGTAPFVATLLVKQTGNPVSPAFYIMALALVSGVAMLMTRDRTNIELDDER
ncbi:MFS transporter [Bradyrhizobium canariense]|uniref:MFS transporter, MHS family, proline/betaine transporter n=1 Tax=Bradyrhizobium canariense TaxID=255045 RepID=A0A1H1PIR8_9BRAD|nr:MFS transporter [Bradyrhizobium canariense]SDS10970.1 MFS transporter, MHS family, proline/betaine transporter [Bradyrhizobium canariense]